MMKYIKHFESFDKKRLDSLISNKDTYIETLLVDINSLKHLSFIQKQLRELDDFSLDIKPYNIEFVASNNYRKILVDYNNLLPIENKFDTNLVFSYSLHNSTDSINEININFKLPLPLRGLRIAYKLYIHSIRHFKIITTNRHTSKEIYSLWYGLLQNKEVYSFTSKNISGCLYKYQSNDELKILLNNIKDVYKIEQLIYDDELIDKIIEIYGSMESYTQRN